MFGRAAQERSESDKVRSTDKTGRVENLRKFIFMIVAGSSVIRPIWKFFTDGFCGNEKNATTEIQSRIVALSGLISAI